MRSAPQTRLLARAFLGDKTLDGLFVIGIQSTRIYCRPSCKPPRIPKLEHRRYYPNPLEAQAAGFRACKLCRPDSTSPEMRQAQMIAALLENALEFASVTQMAQAVHVSPAKLYKLFKQHHGITPAEVLNRKRIEAACGFLVSSQKTVAEIAFEVGFNSLSAFQANFKRLMQMPPLEYRRVRFQGVL
jgi:AraC family transcriptional regulator, regulatory protein of adaptative response / DNA-3-methyladenine glycosylase II